MKNQKENQQSQNTQIHQSNQIQQQIPEHFYDSDLASVNQKDFLSDNQPPKDKPQERKLLIKQKLLHVYKTIVRVGHDINKPARYDKINLKFKEVPQDQVIILKQRSKKQPQIKQEQLPPYFSSLYLMDVQEVVYNLGKQHFQIQNFVISMKRGQVAVFQQQHLQVNKKNNLKVRSKTVVYVIWAFDWTTVIDIDCDGKLFKQVLNKGQGHSRIAKYDQVAFEFLLHKGNNIVINSKYENVVKLQNELINSFPKIFWKLINSMKLKQKIKVQIQQKILKQIQGQQQFNKLNINQNQQKWIVQIQILKFISIDDIFLDGRLLKKTIIKGVSSAKPDSSSLVYFALCIKNGQKIKQDQCFQSDWWEDYGKLQELGCRKHYLDDYSVSPALKQLLKRMKPAQIAQFQCRDARLFQYGIDRDEYISIFGQQIYEKQPFSVKYLVRVYNFKQGKNCFNMQLEQKIHQSKRKKAIGIKQLQSGNIEKAFKTFEIIIGFYSSGLINQAAYDQKISALMNASLCQMKKQNYIQLIKLCDLILQSPKHGYDPDKLQIRGPQFAKVQGKLPQGTDANYRQQANLIQNSTIIDKCLYRKSWGLLKLGQGGKALQLLQRISIINEQVTQLRQQAIKMKQKYETKSVKMYKNMFG